MAKFIHIAGLLGLLALPVQAHEKADWDLLRAMEKGDTVKAQKAILLGASPKLTLPPQAISPLLWATWYQRHGLVQLLLRKGADPNQADQKGDTPLLAALAKKDLPLVTLLLKHGAKVNHPGAGGVTPLAWAVQMGDLPAAQLLVEQGANLYHRDAKGKSPMDWAIFYQHALLIRLLHSHGVPLPLTADTTPLMYAVMQENTELAKLLLINGAAIDARNTVGETALLQAAGRGQIEMVHFLLEKGAKPDLADSHHETALLRAAKYGYREVVQTLLKNGSSLNQTNAQGLNPLMLVAQFGIGNRMGMAQLLLEAGLPVNARDQHQHTALYYAQQRQEMIPDDQNIAFLDMLKLAGGKE